MDNLHDELFRIYAYPQYPDPLRGDVSTVVMIWESRFGGSHIKASAMHMRAHLMPWYAILCVRCVPRIRLSQIVNSGGRGHPDSTVTYAHG